MINFDDMVGRLQNCNLSDISEKTGINYQQLWRIKAGRDKNPTLKIFLAIDKYFTKLKWLELDGKALLIDMINERVEDIINNMNVEEMYSLKDAIKSVSIKLGEQSK